MDRGRILLVSILGSFLFISCGEIGFKSIDSQNYGLDFKGPIDRSLIDRSDPTYLGPMKGFTVDDADGIDPGGINDPSDGVDPGSPVENGNPPTDGDLDANDPNYEDIDVPNFRFCRKDKHPEETAVYSYNQDTGSSNLHFGLVNTDQDFEPDDNEAGNKRIEALVKGFQDPMSITGVMPSSTFDDGSIRYKDAERPVVTIRVSKVKINALRQAQSAQMRITLLFFDDRDGNGQFTNGDRVVSANDVSQSKIEQRDKELSEDDEGARILSDQSSSNEQFEFMMKSYLFNGAGDDCEDIEDVEQRRICERDCDQTSSPLVIDLKGDGIHLTGTESGVLFDIDGDGVKDKISWIQGSSDDALLALDRNKNGTIDDGSELFGNATPVGSGLVASNGFVALSTVDSDRNGLIDEKDDYFNQLLLWRDLNNNGRSESSELFPLSESVSVIFLDYAGVYKRDRFGNTIYAESQAQLTSGHTRRIADVWFRVK